MAHLATHSTVSDGEMGSAPYFPAGVSAAGKYLFAVLDALSSVAESDETNNTPMTEPVL